MRRWRWLIVGASVIAISAAMTVGVSYVWLISPDTSCPARYSAALRDADGLLRAVLTATRVAGRVNGRQRSTPCDDSTSGVVSEVTLDTRPDCPKAQAAFDDAVARRQAQLQESFHLECETTSSSDGYFIAVSTSP